MHWGVEMARKGGVPAKRVLNAMRLAASLRISHAAGERPKLLVRPDLSVQESVLLKIFPAAQIGVRVLIGAIAS